MSEPDIDIPVYHDPGFGWHTFHRRCGWEYPGGSSFHRARCDINAVYRARDQHAATCQ